MIPGVETGSVTAIEDKRGGFAELWRDNRVVQVNLSWSGRSVLRGMHYHLRQTDRWVCLHGRAQIRLVDLRSDGLETMTLDMKTDDWLIIPPGVAHGFLSGPEGFQLLYGVTNTYDGTDEGGFAWDDPAVRPPWKYARRDPPILSERDRHNPPLSTVPTAVTRT